MYEPYLSYTICLPVGPAPLYYVKIISDSIILGNIQKCSAFDITLTAIA